MLTRFAFAHQRLVAMLVVALMAFGAYSYFSLPAQEDPKITIREALVTTRYPGLTPERVEELVTKPLEIAIRQIPEVEEIRSSSLAGESIIHVEVHDRYYELDQIWDDLRDRVEGAQRLLPEGSGRSVVTDDFGDVAVVTAALRFDDHTMAEAGEMARHVRDRLYAVDGVKRVDLHGVLDEAIYVETGNARLAELGIDPDALVAELKTRNVIRPGGELDNGERAWLIEPTGDFESVESIRETLIRAPDGSMIPLRDVATVTRAYVDPPTTKAYVDGEPAIVFAVAMLDGENVLEFSPRLVDELGLIESTLPVGYGLETVTVQAEQVENAVYGVSVNVLQTLAIVLAVVVLLLGVRTGLIVGSIVPVVMLATLAVMGFMDLPLERMSLATLVIALGLLVDNGVVVAEDFKTRMEGGASRDEALVGVGDELALPLLASTATTVLVFLPLMLAEHVAGEYTRSISVIVAITLSLSWVLAMTLTPILCHRFIRVGQGATRPWNERMFDPLQRGYSRALRRVVRHRVLFLGAMLLALAVGAFGVATAPKKFFPSSDRAQVIVYLDLPAGITTRTTDASVARVLPTLDAERFDWLDGHAAYVGYGGPRFVLSLTPIDPAPNRAVLVVQVADAGEVPRAIEELRAHFAERSPELSARVTPMFLGPSDSSILEVQVKGPDRDYLLETAGRIEAILASVPGTLDIRHDWEGRVPRLVADVDQARALQAGVSSADVAESLSGFYSGRRVTEYREGDDTIPVIARAPDAERGSVERTHTLAVFGARGEVVPLAQVADLRTVNGFSRIERENLERTVTVQARSVEVAAEDLAPRVAPLLDELRAELPPGHTIEFDGIITQSGEGRAALLANMPLCLAIVLVLLVAQFDSFRRPVIILGTIPLVIVGVAIGLHGLSADFGFMPILGILSLAGIILNNGIVLIDRIDIERREATDATGRASAIVTASARRLRPILISTVTTVLCLISLIVSRDPLFYGMATVMATGLLVGSVLTLGVVPVAYSLLFREPRAEAAGRASERSLEPSLEAASR